MQKILSEPPAPEPVSPGAESRAIAIDGLRAFVTLLVVAHHAVLAYYPYAPAPAGFTGSNMMWAAFPVVDAVRWKGIELFVAWNDTFFMALMFLLSGLFVAAGLRRKGAGGFLGGRLWRLGIPFVVSAAVLAPLAYYPAFLQAGVGSGVAAFLEKWRALGSWPAGPAWFLWVLLTFDAVAAGLHRVWPRWGEKMAVLGGWAGAQPWRAFLVLLGAGLLAYLPMTLVVNPMSWSSWGPFTVQLARVPLYAVYFSLGVALGAAGVERGLLATDGRLARRWMLWSGVAVLPFVAFLVAFVVTMTALGNGSYRPFMGHGTSAAFVLTGVVTSFALLALFLRWRRKRTWLTTSLSENAYGIYLFHYAIVSWLQLALLPVALPGAAKGVGVIVAAVTLSWLLTAGLRRAPAVARVI